MSYENVVRPCSKRLENCFGECAASCIQALCTCSAYLTVLMAVVWYVLMYMAARLYLIIECFTTLAHLPPEVYLEPSWSSYLPHWGTG